jgi:hypothetical protein
VCVCVCVRERERERELKGAIPLYISIIREYVSFIASRNLLLENEINLHVYYTEIIISCLF